ncbi:hypothetical protein [Amycolatopsis sp. CA-126428]|uniref:hypothetical protein n=1 Tax=Amycolatopsis sp. CA-126428 TaxID=2073158 RepID=UPI001304BABC|nr:hypothetical protein [Amycolatopsis sp. CA-126428]
MTTRRGGIAIRGPAAARPVWTPGLDRLPTGPETGSGRCRTQGRITPSALVRRLRVR